MVSSTKRTLSFSLDTPPDNETKDHLLNIFMNLTELDKPQSERYLEEKDWNIKNALQCFTDTVKLHPAFKNIPPLSEMIS